MNQSPDLSAELRTWFAAGDSGRPPWLLGAGAAAYLAIGVISLEALIVDAVSPFWPGAGVALLLALWFGWRGLAALWLADILVVVLGPSTLDLAYAPWTAAAVTLEAAISAALIVAFRIGAGLRTVPDALGFLVAIVVGGALGAAVGAAALVSSGAEPDLLDAFAQWGLADTCGAFLVGGLGLVVATRPPGERFSRELLGALFLVAAAAALLNLVGTVALVALIPAVTLAAVVGRAPGALGAGVVALLVALPFAEGGASAFADRGSDGVLELEFLITALTVTVLVLASSLDARDDAMADLTERAATDPMTGLPNRFGLENELRRSREGQEIGLILLSVDRFDLVKSGLGYEAGDRFLAEIGARLTAAVPIRATIARLEGEEFAVLTAPETGRNETIGLAERMLSQLGEPFEVDDHQVAPSVSAGIAWSRPGDALGEAAVALHDAKAAGGGRWRLSRAGAGGRHPLRREAELREAIADGQLVPYFQPIVDLGDGTVRGCEALARWRHPRHGLLGPADFIPVAEQGEVIHELGAAMLRTACAAAATWPERVSVAVNISARQLQPGLAEQVERALAEAGIEAGRLELELTETALLDRAASEQTLRALRRIGVGLALDDFGTGWSSFENAQRIEVGTLKIDRGFVARLGADKREIAVVAAMVAMTRAIGAEAVAEGVETAAQDACLRELGVEAAQGFLYSPPVPPEEIRDLLGKRLDSAVQGR